MPNKAFKKDSSRLARVPLSLSLASLKSLINEALGALMIKKTSLLLLLAIMHVCHSNAEPALNECSEKIIPVSPLKLAWPGLPAGGVTEHVISETVTLKFIVTIQGKPSNIEVINTTSRIYVRGAKRTIARTQFVSPIQECIKYMKVDYEDVILDGKSE